MSFSPGAPMLLVDERDRQYLFNIPLENEPAIRIRGENLDQPTLLSQKDGSVLRTELRRKYLVVRPTLEQIIMNMPRQAQVIFPKDLALMMFYGDVAPGQHIVEVGCGHGATTMTILRALGKGGRLLTYDIRSDHLNRTRKNISLYLGQEYLADWQPVLADLTLWGEPEGPEEQDAEHGIDNPALKPLFPASPLPRIQRFFSDIPEPWRLIEAAAEMLDDGGIWVAYVPTVMQLMHQVEGLNKSLFFSMAEGFEALQRYWQVRPPSVRPRHGMRGHTGFIITARRRQRQQ